ncbi:3',5'-cyclic-nucleotide phosphodiesterase [Piscinibacter sakaiensis]|uniref:cAMP phosphodiesterase class-II n=1 Tax=Piscinibacter sakaiensis TaxID=1547922 RepID=A0A0K8P1D6_PISS1|nr:3',5'-cyclic-nucleotide phosphodiesterase [Piscinibacter sakaiensis]GAP36438.1 CAMP phosphodiesterase class-II [Piscinibacter sakaiensis]
MSIRVLGCSGAIAAGCRTTAFLVDERVLIDAGTGVGDLTLDELARIDHICISHSHLDHVLSIALLADAVLRQRLAAGRGSITVHALPATLQALRTHVFNGVIWPDFTRLPSPEAPALRLQPFEIGEVLSLAGRTIEVLPAAHTVPAVGFAVRGRRGHWVFTGDTGPNPALWQRLREIDVADLVIEAAFGDDERALAAISGHHCPATLIPELADLPPGITVHITHIKPGDEAAVLRELAAAWGDAAPRPLVAGQTMALD